MDSVGKYYFIKRKGDATYPLMRMLTLGEALNGEVNTVQAEMNDPIPSKPVWADFLSATRDILDNRIAEVMKSMNMEGVRFFPMKIDARKGEVKENYTCVVVDSNTYEALDKEKSEFKFRNGIYRMKKVILDNEVLSNIPLNKRLGMRLKEAPGYYLYHQSVVDAVMALNPTGMTFQDIETYDGFM